MQENNGMTQEESDRALAKALQESERNRRSVNNRQQVRNGDRCNLS